MSDLQLTITAATVEVGITLLVLLAVLIANPVRSRAVVIIGALTPAIATMLLVAYAQFINPEPGSMAGAGWAMGFVAYMFVLAGGVIISFSSRPANIYGRYILGLASSPVSVGLLVLVPRVLS